MRLLVDGMNVIGSRPDGWWRDRPGAMARLLEELGGLAGISGEEVRVVFDGRAPRDLPAAAGVDVEFAPGGRNSADDRIVEIVANDPKPGSLRVVTSDRELAGRVSKHGAEAMGSGALRRELDGLGGGAA